MFSQDVGMMIMVMLNEPVNDLRHGDILLHFFREVERKLSEVVILYYLV